MAIKDCWKANKERKLHDGHVKMWKSHLTASKKHKAGNAIRSHESQKKQDYAKSKRKYKSGKLPKWMYS